MVVAALCSASFVVVLAASQSFHITRIEIDAGQAQIEFESSVSNYYVLYECTNLLNAGFASNAQPAALDFGQAETSVLTDACCTQAFYRVTSIPTNAPLDLDGDGIDDVYELRTACLDPLNSADAAIDHDEDGFTSLVEYLCGSDPDSDASVPCPPSSPSIDGVVTPTRFPTQAVTGGKVKNTSLWLNGNQIMAFGQESTWSCGVSLVEGPNPLSFVARNAAEQDSAPANTAIALDTVPPVIIVTAPSEGTVVETNEIEVAGTVDGSPFSEPKTLELGLNVLAIQKSDAAGNSTTATVGVFRARQPIPPPAL